MEITPLAKEVSSLFPFRSEKRQPTNDLSTVESQRNDLISEEFPEGPYGSMMLVKTLGKSTPWREDQRPPNAFGYENRELHAGLERNYPGDHELHDLTGPDQSESE